MEHSSIRNALSHKIYSVVYTTFKYHQHTFKFCHIFLSDYSVRAWWIYQRHPLNLKRMECWPHFLSSQKPPKCLSELSIWRLQVAHTNIYRRKTDYVTLQLEQFVPWPISGLFNLGQSSPSSRVHLAMSGAIFVCHNWGVLLASSG